MKIQEDNIEPEQGFIHNRQITDEERRNSKTKGFYTVFPNPLNAGGPQEVRLSYTVGLEGIPIGGGIKVEIPQVWFRPQFNNPKGENFVTIYGIEKNNYYLRMTKDEVWEYYLTIILRNRELKPNDVITIVLGDKSQGGAGAYVQRFVQKGDFESSINRLNIFVDTDASGNFQFVSPEIPISVVGNKPQFFTVIAPSFAAKNARFGVKIIALDRYRNVGHPPYQGTINIKCSDSLSKFKKNIEMSGKDNGVVNVPSIQLDDYGTFFLTAYSADGSIAGKSNPIVISDKPGEYNLFWGEIHTHTSLSDGRGTPEDAYIYAREIAGLDFASITDHAHFDFTDEAWERTKLSAKRFNDPGRFVTIPAYEWTRSWDHRNVYYLEDDEPVFRDDDPESDTPEKLWECLAGKKAIVIPHHNLFCHKWEKHNPEFERSVEIYSMWGLSEYKNNPLWTLNNPNGGISVREMLATGAKLGFTAGQDNHDGRPGATASESCSWNLKYRGGLIAVWAEELSRESIFNAIRERRTYGTTGERIIVKFRINNHWMGEEFVVNSPPEVSAEVIGTDKIDMIELIRNGDTIHTVSGDSYHLSLSFTDNNIPKGDNYYYIRMSQSDGNMAWASPIFVNLK